MTKNRRIGDRWMTWGEIGRKKTQIVKNIPYKNHLRGIRTAKKVKKKQLMHGLLSACFGVFMLIMGLIFGYWIYVAIIFVVGELLLAIAAFYD